MLPAFLAWALTALGPHLRFEIINFQMQKQIHFQCSKALQLYEDQNVQQEAFTLIRHYVQRVRTYYELAQRIEQVLNLI